ncbi:MAG: nicotinate phosphoribosyltransferase [Gemmatimonadetes bacterium]|nr:nicotinate phosphoribosyltransferase [Gemmatimonadota bacterium]
MAYGYWKTGRHRLEAVFHHTFRTLPFGGGFAVACGLTPAIEYIEAFRFESDDLDYLAALKGANGEPLFETRFLEYLRALRIDCDVDMVREGTVVFPHEPLLRVRGPIIQAQLLETALLNQVNFQTLIATKAARVCLAAEGEEVLEFGLRRAQGIDGGVSASRAAYVGGCAATSNVLAGKLHGIPVRGTHAHSWVMAFASEVEAFEAYAEAMPNNCVFLVDTFDTLQGVRNAVRVGQRLRDTGHRLLGIRLDSGDLAYLSIEARRILDEAGFQDASIFASSELNEQIIASLKQQGAAIDRWAVGTQLATAYDQPALGGVYKLAAVREHGGEWEPRIKLSEQAVKVSNPGILQTRRFVLDGEMAGDMIFDELFPPPDGRTIVDPLDMTRRKHFAATASHYDLLVPVFRAGRRVYDPPSLAASRDHARQELASLHSGAKRSVNPHLYPVGLEPGLHERKTELILKARAQARRVEPGNA